MQSIELRVGDRYYNTKLKELEITKIVNNHCLVAYVHSKKEALKSGDDGYLTEYSYSCEQIVNSILSGAYAYTPVQREVVNTEYYEVY